MPFCRPPPPPQLSLVATCRHQPPYRDPVTLGGAPGRCWAFWGPCYGVTGRLPHPTLSLFFLGILPTNPLWGGAGGSNDVGADLRLVPLGWGEGADRVGKAFPGGQPWGWAQGTPRLLGQPLIY